MLFKSVDLVLHVTFHFMQMFCLAPLYVMTGLSETGLPPYLCRCIICACVFLSGHERMISSFWTSAYHRTSLKCMAFERVLKDENDKMSPLSFTFQTSGFSIACLGEDEEPLVLTIQFCPVLSVFLLRCFLFAFAQSCASLSTMA